MHKKKIHYVRSTWLQAYQNQQHFTPGQARRIKKRSTKENDLWLFSIYIQSTYCRAGFNGKNVINVNSNFFQVAMIEMQRKIYKMIKNK